MLVRNVDSGAWCYCCTPSLWLQASGLQQCLVSLLYALTLVAGLWSTAVLGVTTARPHFGCRPLVYSSAWCYYCTPSLWLQASGLQQCLVLLLYSLTLVADLWSTELTTNV
jgi:hypothetical protein